MSVKLSYSTSIEELIDFLQVDKKMGSDEGYLHLDDMLCVCVMCYVVCVCNVLCSDGVTRDDRIQVGM